MYIQVKNPSSTLNHKIVEVVPAPIDEKNILSDWIDEELLDNCSQNGNEYLGWLNNKYPIYGKVEKDGTLSLRPFDSVAMPLLRDKLVEMFPESSGNGIYMRLTLLPDLWKVSFYFILDN